MEIAFQAPGFYERCSFELEFVRENKSDPRLSKYFYIKSLRRPVAGIES